MAPIRRVLPVIMISILLCGNIDAEEVQTEKPPESKSVAAGIILGSFGFFGLFVPGACGWGHLYAGDTRGFWILNIGGSAFTLLLYYGARWAPDGYDYGCVAGGFLGITAFALASVIGGARAVSEYNRHLRSSGLLRLRFYPSARGMVLAVSIGH